MLAEPEDEEYHHALAPEEMARLLEATAKAPDWSGTTGYDRAVFYLMAVETGIRRAALMGLTVNKFVEISVWSRFYTSKTRNRPV